MVNPTPVPELDPQLIIQTPVPEPEPKKELPILGRDYITEEEAKNWVNPNARRFKEHFRAWEKDWFKGEKNLI